MDHLLAKAWRGGVVVLLAATLVLGACRPAEQSDWSYHEREYSEYVSLSLLVYFHEYNYMFNSTLTADLVNLSALERYDLVLDSYLDGAAAELLAEFDESTLPTTGGGGLAGGEFPEDYGEFLVDGFRDEIIRLTTERLDTYSPGDCFELSMEFGGLAPGDPEDVFATGLFRSPAWEPTCAPGPGLIDRG